MEAGSTSLEFFDVFALFLRARGGLLKQGLELLDVFALFLRARGGLPKLGLELLEPRRYYCLPNHLK
jgi:hypothetical protein